MKNQTSWRPGQQEGADGGAERIQIKRGHVFLQEMRKQGVSVTVHGRNENGQDVRTSRYLKKACSNLTAGTVSDLTMIRFYR